MKRKKKHLSILDECFKGEVFWLLFPNFRALGIDSRCLGICQPIFGRGIINTQNLNVLFKNILLLDSHTQSTERGKYKCACLVTFGNVLVFKLIC